MEPCTGSAEAPLARPRASPAPGWPDSPLPRPDSAFGRWPCCPMKRRFPKEGCLLKKGCLLHTGGLRPGKKEGSTCRADEKDVPTWKVESNQAGLPVALLRQPSHGAASSCPARPAPRAPFCVLAPQQLGHHLLAPGTNYHFVSLPFSMCFQPLSPPVSMSTPSGPCSKARTSCSLSRDGPPAQDDHDLTPRACWCCDSSKEGDPGPRHTPFPHQEGAPAVGGGGHQAQSGPSAAGFLTWDDFAPGDIRAFLIVTI